MRFLRYWLQRFINGWLRNKALRTLIIFKGATKLGISLRRQQSSLKEFSTRQYFAIQDKLNWRDCIERVLATPKVQELLANRLHHYGQILNKWLLCLRSCWCVHRCPEKLGLTFLVDQSLMQIPNGWRIRDNQIYTFARDSPHDPRSSDHSGRWSCYILFMQALTAPIKLGSFIMDAAVPTNQMSAGWSGGNWFALKLSEVTELSRLAGKKAGSRSPIGRMNANQQTPENVSVPGWICNHLWKISNDWFRRCWLCCLVKCLLLALPFEGKREPSQRSDRPDS